MVELPDSLLTQVARPARYLGCEHNAVHKDLRSVEVKFALAFPDVYEVGMSHLGSRILYSILNARSDCACERVFAPWVDMERLMRQNGIPLFSLEGREPMRNFDIVGFSLQYELLYTNVLNMLDLAGIPIRSSERNEGHPLIIAGGQGAFNSRPLNKFIDAFVLGEGEEVIGEIVDAYKDIAGRGSAGLRVSESAGLRVSESAGRRALLERLAAIQGVYVPTHPRPVTRRFVKDLNQAPYPTKQIVPYMQIVHDRISLEIMRGCVSGCKFCQAARVSSPRRYRSLDSLVRLAEETYRNTGYEEISLVSLSSSDYPELEELARRLTREFAPQGVGLSLPSLRPNKNLIPIARMIESVRKTGLTFAPEAGTARLREYINKDMDEEALIEVIRMARSFGWRRVKLYFMIGLPTETEGDLDGILELAHRATAGLNATISISTFVPKPETPFADEEMLSLEEIIARQRYLKKANRSSRIRLSFHPAEMSAVEGLLACGGESVGDVIYRAWKLGAQFDGWREGFRFDLWQEAMRGTAKAQGDNKL